MSAPTFDPTPRPALQPRPAGAASTPTPVPGVDPRALGRGSTADTQFPLGKTKLTKLKVQVPKLLRSDLEREASEQGLDLDQYVTRILRERR